MARCKNYDMQDTTRTTIRVQTDLLDKSRQIAIKQKSSLQDVINHVLSVGFKHISDINRTENAIKQIDDFRGKMSKKDINLQELLSDGAKDKK